MKIKWTPILLLGICSLSALLLYRIFGQGIYSSHDGEIHIARIAGFTNSVGQGQFVPSWLPNWNYQYGYPSFIYIYLLPYYLASFFRLFNLEYEVIFKILIYLSLAFSGVTFYFFSKVLLKKDSLLIKETASTLGAILYITTPYRFADIYERGALGECLSFILIPLLFLATCLFPRRPFFYTILIAILIFSFITTHLLTFMIFIPVVFFYGLFFSNKKFKYIFYFLLACFIGLAASSFQWLPPFFEQQYMDSESYLQLYKAHFLTINQLLRIPKDGKVVGTGIQMGAVQTLILIIASLSLLYGLFFKKKRNQKIAFFLIVSIIAGYLTTNYSQIIWNSFEPLKSILFPWRFLTLTTFSAAVLSVLLLAKLQQTNQKIILALIPLFIFIFIFPSRHYFKSADAHSYDDSFYEKYNDLLRLDNYFLPKTFNKQIQYLQLGNITVIEGKARATSLREKSTSLLFEIDSQNKSKVIFHVMDFPGWKIKVNGNTEKIVNDTKNLEGLIATNLDPGSNKVELIYNQTPLRRLGLIISLFSLSSLLIVFVLYRIYLVQFSKFSKQTE